MGGHKKRKGLKARRHASEDKERDLDTIRAINKVLDTEPVDTAQLRKIAAVRGLVNNEVRMRVWPVLVGAHDHADEEGEDYAELAKASHRDSSTVSCDVERSLWSFTRGWTAEMRQQKREELHRLLTAAVSSGPQEMFYYQGLHDVAGVLLLVLGEASAFRVLRVLCRTHLRDATRPDLSATLENLGLLLPILAQADPELYRYVAGTEVLPFFGLSWLITWFSHSVSSLHDAARLFDLFLASHPLGPLYVAAVIMRLDLDTICREAVHLFVAAPPQQLISKYRIPITVCTAPEASLQDGHWTVPEKASVPSRGITMESLQSLAHYLLEPAGKKRPAPLLFGVLAASTLIPVLLALAFANRSQLVVYPGTW